VQGARAWITTEELLMRRRSRAAVAWVVLAFGGLGPVARGDGIDVFAAASLTDALGAIGRAWEGASGTRVSFNFAGSNDLARQIRAGAPADVFVSADPAQMDTLERAGLVRAGERVDLLSNVLVVVVPRDAAFTPAATAELRRVRRLALADPQAVPAGVYARQWLERVGLWAELRERVVPALDVRAALAAVEAGHVEAGVVYRTDAALAPRARTAFTVPREDGPQITYVAAPLRASKHAAAAAAFVRHLRSAEAASVFERHGFLVLAAP
jgi:molybdate transport system substrate-binding protein